MDGASLKKAVGSIEMTDAMRQRIAANSKKILMKDLEDTMKKTKRWSRWPMAVAAVLALCVCLPVAGMAMGNSGFFRDVIRGTAVVGTEYEQATGEIRVSAGFSGGALAVTVDFLMPDAFPYRELEELAVGSYQIVDKTGTVVSEGKESEAAAIANGQAVILIPAEELDPGDYRLRINSFVGSKKAEQPLPMKGSWKCEITVE